MSERLFRAYFCEGLLVSDHWVLTALANEVGVGEVESLWPVISTLAKFAPMKSRLRNWNYRVPSLLIDEKFMVSALKAATTSLTFSPERGRRVTA